MGPDGQLSLFDGPADRATVEPPATMPPDEASPVPVRAPSEVPPLPDADARAYAVDPRHNLLLEASAGTGKTSVLVQRYVNLLRAGVDPANVLAITFTRKAAAEMRERIIAELRALATLSPGDQARWRELRDRLGDISIGTIDAFCLSLLREFPLEADLDPGFTLADETEVPRLVDEALDRTLRICRSLARTDPDVALVFARLEVPQIKAGLAHLLERRLVAPAALARFLANGPRDLTADLACRRAAERLRDVLNGVSGGLSGFVADGPLHHPRFQLLARDLRSIPRLPEADSPAIRSVMDRVADHFLKQDGEPRKTLSYLKQDFASAAAYRRHKAGVTAIAPAVQSVLAGLQRDLNVVSARAVHRMFAIAMSEYRRTLDAYGVIDFGDALSRALDLLRQMDEFAQSRYRLESRYHHVLVDELQDTSRAQWELVSLLIESWGEGFGLVHEAPLQPSIFVVGDRKQSIYRFRDAEVAVLEEAGRYIDAIRPADRARRWISHSFRAVPGLLAFVNDLFADVEKLDARDDAFRYDERDRFPVSESADRSHEAPVLGLAAGKSVEYCTDAVAEEIARLLRDESVRDRNTGVIRQATPGDIAILFRSRESHREYETALELRGIPAYVYKGLGFFDADEIKDLCALLRYLADPASDLRAAAFLRSRFVRLSDPALSALAPRIADALTSSSPPAALSGLCSEDADVLEALRGNLREWLALIDRLPPAEVIDRILSESAYGFELRGHRVRQSRENLKKLRGLVRRIQNRGYATIARIAEYVDQLSAGDESNAIVDALDAVNLMTIHAAKGLEFPVVFIVNLARGTGGAAPPIRILTDSEEGEPVISVGDFGSAAEDDERAREREETKRLLYVAATRARDRLYLSSVLRDGEMKPARGSLGEILPPTLCATIARAGDAHEPDNRATWISAGGVTHRFAICRPIPMRPAAEGSPSGLPDGRAAAGHGAPAVEAHDDFESLVGLEETPRVTVTGLLREPASADCRVDADRRSDVVLGRLVHWLLQPALAASAGHNEDDLRRLAESWLQGADDPPSLKDRPALVERAVQVCQTFRNRADLAAVLDGSETLYEVPFSMRVAPTDRLGRCMPVSASGRQAILRGTIDCLVYRPDGGITVVEFKTGALRTDDRAQLDFYVEAVRGLHPGALVDGLLIAALDDGQADWAAGDVVAK